jgi:hypothetical protein
LIEEENLKNTIQSEAFYVKIRLEFLHIRELTEPVEEEDDIEENDFIEQYEDLILT